MKRAVIIILVLIVGLALLPGCGSLISRSVTSTPVPGTGNEVATTVAEPVQPETEAPEGEALVNLVPITVEDVRVEVGVGSPIPVTVRVAGTWPSLCSQLATVTQSQAGFHFDIELRADPGDATCPPDNVGLTFSMGIPINGVELPTGRYSVSVNGVTGTLDGAAAAFDVPLTPTIGMEPEESPSSGEMPPQAHVPCPEVTRPALLLGLPAGGYLVTNPVSGDECRPVIDEQPGSLRAGRDGVYYVVADGEQYIIRQLVGGHGIQLPFTAVAAAEAVAFHNFIVSPDGTTLAWAAGAPAPEDAGVIASQMWVGETATGDAWTPLPPYRSEDPVGFGDIMVPVRFSTDNSVLYYTIQPYGIGGVWHSFTGRYDNLYAIRLKSEAPPEQIFDCAEHGLMLCLGDFFVVDNQVTALAYVDAANDLVIENGAGQILNTIALDEEYVAYPTWSDGGELVFYAADIDDSGGLPRPSAATLYRVAPHTAPAEALVSDPGLLPPQAWLDETHLVTGYSASESSWGTVVVGLDGELSFPSDPNAYFVTVLP